MNPFILAALLTLAASPQPGESALKSPSGKQADGSATAPRRRSLHTDMMIELPRHKVPEGTFLEAKLTTTVDSRLPGFLKAVVTKEVLVDGVSVIPVGATILCKSEAETISRVPIVCNKLDIQSHGITELSGVGFGADDAQAVPLPHRNSAPEPLVKGTVFRVLLTAPFQPSAGGG